MGGQHSVRSCIHPFSQTSPSYNLPTCWWSLPNRRLALCIIIQNTTSVLDNAPTVQVLWLRGSMRLISVRKGGQSRSLKKESFHSCPEPRRQQAWSSLTPMSRSQDYYGLLRIVLLSKDLICSIITSVAFGNICSTWRDVVSPDNTLAVVSLKHN